MLGNMIWMTVRLLANIGIPALISIIVGLATRTPAKTAVIPGAPDAGMGLILFGVGMLFCAMEFYLNSNLRPVTEQCEGEVL